MREYRRGIKRSWCLWRKVDHVARRGAGHSVSLSEMADSLGAKVEGLVRTLSKFNIDFDKDADRVQFPQTVRRVRKPLDGAKRDMPDRVSASSGSRSHGAGSAHHREGQ